MTAPEEAARRFLWACLLGLPLGAAYDFLRPLRPKFTAVSDGLFLLAAGWAWLYLGFGICRGDLRLGYSAGLLAGGLVWEGTAGVVFRPVSASFWKLVEGILQKMALPIKKISKFLKILFASGEKWVTIRWNNRRQKHPRPRGGTHGRRDRGRGTCGRGTRG